MDQKKSELMSEWKTVMGHDFDRAKFWWGASLGLQCVGILASTSLSFVDPLNPVVSLCVAGAFPLVGAACKWASDVKRGRADGILREIEYLDAYGGNARARNVANAVSAANLTRAAIRTLEKRVSQPEWATSEKHGPSRALRNVRESAWWSQQLALAHFRYVLVLLLVIAVGWVVFGFAVLAVSIPDDLRTAIAKTSLAFITVALSGGFVKLSFDYNDFASKCSRIVERCEQLLAVPHTDIEAVRTMADYQLLRNKAPQLFSIVHRQRADEFNARWRDIEHCDG